MMCHHLYNTLIHHTPAVLSVILLVLGGSVTIAQNLVPNPGFEEVYDCNEFVDCWNNQPSPCPPWYCVNSENYFNSCSSVPAFGVPNNFRGYQYPNSGEGYGGGYQKLSREFLRVQLTQPLIAGTCYTASMYVNNADESCSITKLGMLLTKEYVSNPVGMSPQVEGDGHYYSDTANWVLITGTFIAFGGEEYLTIGNFYTNAQSPYNPECAPFAEYAYYYFDDIVVEEGSTEIIDVNLGGPYEECDFVILEPQGQNNFSYLWSDGSTSSSLIVTTSGTYSVTVYDHANCIAGIDSADVIVLGSLPVYLGPDTTLCLEESHTITLDEDLGDYVWADGSTDSEFTISDPGTYSVTFDDGCDITIDHIVVTYISAPEFTLGEDTILCPGATYWLNMDPDLGDFLWDNNSSSSSYLFDEPGLYALTISNQCGDYSDQIEITYVDPPLFDLGPDSTVLCLGSNINLQFDQGLGDFLWQDGSTNPDFMITTTGLYSLTVSNHCGTLADEMHVQQIQVPVVVLGGSIELCPGESEILDPGYNYGVYVWQDGSTDQVYNVTTSGIYAVTVTNECGTDDASVVVEVAPPVVPPDLGPDVSLCPGETLILEITDQAADILWNDLSTNATLQVSSSGTYYVQVSTYCESFSDTILVTIQNSPPSINLPPDFALCQGQSVTLDAGVSNVSYLWNDGSQLPQLSVSSPGVYALTVSNACGTDIDTVTIVSGGPAPSVSLGQDTSICPGSTLAILPSSANVNEWNWSDGSDTTFFIASAPGMVTVEVSNECGMAYDTMLIVLMPAVPALILGPDTMICPGETVTLSIQILDVIITWPDGSQQPDFTVSDSALVIASISNACGVSVDSLDVELLPDIPLLYLGPDQTICPGEMITVAPGIADVQYQWHDGSTSNVFQTTLPDTIELEISNICGSRLDTLIITESTVGPQLDLGPDIHACVGSTVNIHAGILGVNYLWQDGSTNESYSTSLSGTYYLSVENLCGVDSDTIIVDISALPPSVFLGPDTVLCVGTSMTLTSIADSSTTVMWQDGSSAQEFDVFSSGEYHLTESNLCGTDSDTIVIEIDGVVPVADLGSDTSLCIGETLTLISHADTSATTTWQDGSTTPDFHVFSSGIYHLTLTNACGTDRDSITVLIDGVTPSPELGPDTTLCAGNTMVLILEADTGVMTEWQDGSTGLSFLVDAPGTYSLRQTNACGEGADTIQISYQYPPDFFDLGNDTLLCPGEILLLTAPSTTNHMQWQDGSLGSTYAVQQAGVYTLTILNECGVEKDELEIGYIEDHIQIALDDQVELCPGEVIVLDATQSFEANYLWNTGSALPFITITTPGSYSVTVRTDCAEEIHVVSVSQNEDCKTGSGFYIPNVFSPNGDNINDQFIIVPGPEIEIIKMEGFIYDRWGGVMFQSESNPFTWDGRMSGEDVLPGVYVYRLNINYLNDGRQYSDLLIGNVTVVR